MRSVANRDKCLRQSLRYADVKDVADDAKARRCDVVPLRTCSSLVWEVEVPHRAEFVIHVDLRYVAGWIPRCEHLESLARAHDVTLRENRARDPLHAGIHEKAVQNRLNAKADFTHVVDVHDEAASALRLVERTSAEHHKNLAAVSLARQAQPAGAWWTQNLAWRSRGIPRRGHLDADDAIRNALKCHAAEQLAHVVCARKLGAGTLVREDVATRWLGLKIGRTNAHGIVRVCDPVSPKVLDIPLGASRLPRREKNRVNHVQHSVACILAVRGNDLCAIASALQTHGRAHESG